MKINKIIGRSLTALVLSLMSSIALAIPIISLQPALATGAVGDSIFVDLL